MFWFLLLWGCSTPEFAQREPRLTYPESWATETATPEAAVATAGLLDLFDDAYLDAYVSQVLTNNLDLTQAMLRLEQVQLSTELAEAARWPSVVADGSAGRSKSLPQGTRSTFSLGLGLQWEADLWGRLAAQADAADETFFSELYSVQALRQSLAARSIQTWIQWLLEEQLTWVQSNRVENLVATEQLIYDRYQTGQATLSEVEAARSDAALAKVALTTQRENAKEALRAIYVLAGGYPFVTRPNVEALSFPEFDRDITTGLPSELLLRRPDILAAFHAIKAADAESKASYRALFPSFPLTSSYGQRSEVLDELFQSDFSVWSVVAGFTTPVFNAGRLRGQYNQNLAAAESAYLAYTETVLNAFKEVETALSLEHNLVERARLLQIALAAALRAQDTATEEYRNGLIDVTRLLLNERQVFTVREQVLRVEALRRVNRVRLGLALGVGL